MADLTPRWNGDDYQSRNFWLHAYALLDESNPHVFEVTFEAEGPKSFDDVVVFYKPSRPSNGLHRISADYFQIKWHVEIARHFGYQDLVDPKFINATSTSLLERLRDAKAKSGEGSAFHLISTHPISQDDPLRELVSGVDSSIRLNVLAVGKTAKSKMGRVRKLWREHLGLATDAELFEVLEGFHIKASAINLDDLRSDVSLRLKFVGLDAKEGETVFPYDQIARKLAGKKMNKLNRALLKNFLKEEGLFVARQPKGRRGVSIQTYTPKATPADMLLAGADATLSLIHKFNDRILLANESWEEIKFDVEQFLRGQLSKDSEIRLFLDAPTSIAFLSGACLGPKSGASVEVIQSGAGNRNQVWDTEDGRTGPAPEYEVMEVGEGDDVAVVVSLTRNALSKVEEYVKSNIHSVGRILHVTPEGDPGHNSIRGGEHALKMATAISDKVSDLAKFGSTSHIFMAAPNAVSFYLGQNADYMGRCALYEFDFKKEIHGSYFYSFCVG